MDDLGRESEVSKHLEEHLPRHGVKGLYKINEKDPWTYPSEA
jgi:hypothetical protein